MSLYKTFLYIYIFASLPERHFFLSSRNDSTDAFNNRRDRILMLQRGLIQKHDYLQPNELKCDQNSILPDTKNMIEVCTSVTLVYPLLDLL